MIKLDRLDMRAYAGSDLLNSRSYFNDGGLAVTVKAFLMLAISIVLLFGCGGNSDRVLFLTTTQIGIDADSKAQSATIGYERYEGYVGPGYEDGGVPPVIARLESTCRSSIQRSAKSTPLVMRLVLRLEGSQNGMRSH